MSNREILTNAALGEPYAPFRDEKKLVVAYGWAPWWQPATEEDLGWKNRQPVYGKYTLDGSPVQQLSTPFGTHVAGLWQQVPSAAGNRYEFTAEGQAWSSEDAAPGTQLEATDVNMQIGVDPTGGLDPDSPLIDWSEPLQPLSRWETLRLIVDAEASILTLFLKSSPTLPKRQQSIFWRNARLRPIGRHKRAINIIGAGDTHITLDPEQPQPHESIMVAVSSTRPHEQVSLIALEPGGTDATIPVKTYLRDEDRHIWRHEFTPGHDGLYDLRFVGDQGARLLSLRLVRVARELQLVPSDAARLDYQRVYVLLPPTASVNWLLAAARGSFDRRYTIGFSADDAGIGDLENRHVLAVNPHHWPEVLTAAWFKQHYPGVKFTAIVANTPEDLESWLETWEG